jgi:protein TonB
LPSPLEIPVRLRIGRDGRVTSVEPADPALSTELREALERSAQAMRFVPARLGAEPIEAWFAMTFIYRR